MKSSEDIGKFSVNPQGKMENSSQWKNTLNTLQKVWHEIEENDRMFLSEKTEGRYFRAITKTLSGYHSAPSAVKVLNEKICAQLFHYSGQDSVAPLDPRLFTVMESTINPSDTPDYAERLKLLGRIENLHANENHSPSVFREETLHLVKTLETAAENPNANLLQSNYIRVFSQHPEYQGTYNGTNGLRDIGGGTIADISKGIWQDAIRIKTPDGTWEKIDPKHFLTKKSVLNEQSASMLFAMLWSNDSFRTTVEENIGIHFSEYSLPEQFHTLAFLSEATNKEADDVRKFSDVYGHAGFRTFLSLGQGGKDMGEKILMLGKKLPKDNAKLLFGKYGEIIDEITGVEEYLRASLGERITQDLVDDTREQLFQKGKDLLARYAVRTETCVDQDCAALGTELTNHLADLKTSIVLLAGTVKSLVERGEFNMKDLKDVSIAYDEHGTLTEKDKAMIAAMAHENTKQYPEKLRDYWRSTAEKALEHPAPGETFISVKYQGEIVCAMRVIPQADGSFYGGSFNVNPAIKGSHIGTELLREVIEKYTERGDFVADCYNKNPMIDVYTGKFGFEITGSVENYHDTGATILNIVKRKKNRAE